MLNPAQSRPLLLACALLAACSPAQSPQTAADTAAASGATAGAPAATAEWEDLSDLSRWRGFRRQDLPASWSMQDGAIAFAPSADRAQRGDIVTREQYGDFELEYEWKISPGGNSGVIYRATEDQTEPWRTGPEMQVLDDERHSDGRIPSHRAGALYDMIVPPEGITRPVGEWNQARIVVRGNHVQQWLNGHKTADIVIGSPEWNQRIQQSKWKDVPTYGTKSAGHIALQDHDDPVWYRNLRIRRLDGIGNRD